MKKKDDRQTIRFNETERAELELFKKSFNIDNDSEALKTSLIWVNSYIKNVAQMFFPPTHDVVLMKKFKP